MSTDRSAGVNVSRRDWFAAGIRYSLLGGIALLAAWCGIRPSHSPCPDESAACRDCRRLARCGLPRGIRTRRTYHIEEVT